MFLELWSNYLTFLDLSSFIYIIRIVAFLRFSVRTALG